MTDTDLAVLLEQPPRSRRRRIAGWAAIGALLVLLLVLVARCVAPASPASYATAPVTRGDLTVTISATGNLAPTKQVNVGSEESGLVAKVYVQNNDRVRAGQPIAELDLSRLRDALLQSQASLQSSVASVAQNEATLAQTKANLARYEQLFQLSGGKVPSRTEFDTARAEYARAVANLAAARAQVVQARAQLPTNQTNLSKAPSMPPSPA